VRRRIENCASGPHLAKGGDQSVLVVSVFVESNHQEVQTLSRIVGEQLSAVVFVQDYLQLQFDGPTLTLSGATLTLTQLEPFILFANQTKRVTVLSPFLRTCTVTSGIFYKREWKHGRRRT
jgi:hypothetical protein